METMRRVSRPEATSSSLRLSRSRWGAIRQVPREATRAKPAGVRTLGVAGCAGAEWGLYSPSTAEPHLPLGFGFGGGDFFFGGGVTLISPGWSTNRFRRSDLLL